jgi:autotransporter strand-loop-strand O-heptosyltransferase
MNIKINCHFIDGAFIEILGNEEDKKKYKVKFINKQTNKIEYETDLSINTWARTSKKYFIDWKIEVYIDTLLIYTHEINFDNKSVFIELCSSSLGDTLAWIPAVDIFQKTYGCKVYCSTFLNSLFKEQYNNIEFINPGDAVSPIYAQYKIGWFYDDNSIDLRMHKYDFKKYNLQDTAFQILGLPFSEIKPKIKVPNKVKKRQVCIGIHATARAKYWNNPGAWQTVVDYLNKNKYDVLLITKEHNGWMGSETINGIIDKTGHASLEDRIAQLAESELFIGLGSGLSWLAWATGVNTILISGFSEKYSEFTPTARIINEKVCHGCFNNIKLDPSDWNWCPIFKGTDNQFLCTKEITPDEVIKSISSILKIDN